VNREHFKAFLWLRWRLRVNQFRKAGVANLVFFLIVAVGAVVAAVGLFIAGFFVGWLALPKTPGYVRLYVWDGIVVAFLFSWMIGLLTELQRTESLSLDKFLHLPVSISGAFVINYLSSLFSLTLLVFVPTSIGLTLGQTIAHGPAMLLALPLIAAFILAVTAITYQFQGWLATLMTNPRKRRTVVVVVMMCFILVAQFPNLINVVRPWDNVSKPLTQFNERQQEIVRAFNAKEIDLTEQQKRMRESNEQFKTEQDSASNETLERVERTTRMMNLAIPFGWMPLGAAALPDNDVLPSLLATLGLALIGAASLSRAYRTTVRLYTGQYNSGEHRQETPAPVITTSTKPRLLEKQLPVISEQATVVALAGFRSLIRAPEAKMALLAPIIMVVVFGGIFLSSKVTLPDEARPFLAIGGAGVVLLSAIQLIGNQFGYDRSGFRAFVLSPIPRREILLGKNLAVAPLAIGLGTVIIILVGSVFPMRFDQYPAALLQLISTYLIFCLLANILSILAPMAIAPGSMKASNVKIVPVLLQLAFMMMLPIVFLPAMLSVGTETLLNEVAGTNGWPISLALSIVTLPLVVLIYRKVITLEGDWLLSREQKVLEVVTSKSE
jgi:ABC-2 type transport system permease protein